MPSRTLRFDSAHEIPDSENTKLSTSPQRNDSHSATSVINSSPPPDPSSPVPTRASLLTALKTTIGHITETLDPAGKALVTRALEPENFIIVLSGSLGGWDRARTLTRDRRWPWGEIPLAAIEREGRTVVVNLLREAEKEVVWMERHLERLRRLLESREKGRMQWAVFWVEESQECGGGKEQSGRARRVY